MTSEDLIWTWLRFGWKYRGIGKRPREQRDWFTGRIKYEMGLIIDKDYIDFFLATSDMVRWAKDYRGPEAPHGIPVGPGRGSVAASVVSWILRITEVDPYKYPNLLFERFIDVTRSDPPDIDLDISDEHRYLVRDYMSERYGAGCVGTVANFVRYRGKNSLADVARVYGVPSYAKEIVSNLVIERSGGDSRFDATLGDTIELFPAAKEVFETYPDLWKATRLEGNMRGMSVHAAGLIVTPTPITDICAIYDRGERSILSIDKYDVDAAGMLKMDVLGLSTMGVIANCLEMTGLTLEDLYGIPDDDSSTLDIFKRGDVVGIFQYEGRATRLINRDVSPDNFGEVIDINALSRPGPLFSGTTAEYVDVKHGRREPERYHDVVTQITNHTKGQIIYQEQILQIVRTVGGFDWTNANEIRRIISKKIGEAAFNVSKERFTEGADRLHGITPETADRIWKRIVTSGTYAFVYAHSVSYAILANWCAYLKAHHPLEFYVAHLAKTGDKEQRFKLMKDALAHGIDVKPPTLAISNSNWRPFTNPKTGSRMLVAGWRQVPGIGEITAQSMELDTELNGRFQNWEDMSRIKGIGPKTVEKIQEFASSDDPFELLLTGKRIGRVKKWISRQDRVPYPTHNGSKLAEIYMQDDQIKGRKSKQKGPYVVYAGIAKERNYQDAIENWRSRSGLEIEEIMKQLYRPDLVKYCHFRCIDDTDEEIYLRINRFDFPKLRRQVDGVHLNHDVIICAGHRIAGFGTPVMVSKLWIIDPDA